MKRILADIYKGILGNAEFVFRKFTYPEDELIVLCMHSTPKDRMPDFERLVKFITDHFNPLLPSDLESYMAGERKEGPYVLFTFDDGLRNNLFAAEVLERLGIRAFFFLIPEFIRARDQKAYYLQNIRQVIDPSFDKSEEDFTAMNYAIARELIARGHRIGSHTMSHLLRAGSDALTIEEEISGSLETLKKELGDTVNSFCSPISTTISVSAPAKDAILRNYCFHFTTFPGLNGVRKDPQLILRRNIEVNWTYGKIKFALGVWDLPRWQPEIEQFALL